VTRAMGGRAEDAIPAAVSVELCAGLLQLADLIVSRDH
jgi:hypothetical protein